MSTNILFTTTIYFYPWVHKDKQLHQKSMSTIQYIWNTRNPSTIQTVKPQWQGSALENIMSPKSCRRVKYQTNYNHGGIFHKLWDVPVERFDQEFASPKIKEISHWHNFRILTENTERSTTISFIKTRSV